MHKKPQTEVKIEIWARRHQGGCHDPGLPEVPGAQRAARTHLDVVILGARHHQVVVARRLVYRQAHHGPDVAAQLPDGLQPTETGGWGQLSQKSSPKSFPQQAKVPPSPALTPRGAPSLLITPLGPKIPYYYYSAANEAFPFPRGVLLGTSEQREAPPESRPALTCSAPRCGRSCRWRRRAWCRWG